MFLLKCMQNVQTAASACGLGQRRKAFWSDTTAISPSVCVHIHAYIHLPSLLRSTHFHLWILLKQSLKLSTESITQPVARGIRKPQTLLLTRQMLFSEGKAPARDWRSSGTEELFHSMQMTLNTLYRWPWASPLPCEVTLSHQSLLLENGSMDCF